MPLDVICPECRQCFFETNDDDGTNPHVEQRPGAMPVGTRSVLIRKYDSDAIANAAMLRLKEEFVSIYDDIVHHEGLVGFAIEPCPGCGGPLSNDGFKLETRKRLEDSLEEGALDPLICEICNKGPFKNKQGKNNHIRMKHP